jgi:FtsP/CotA-like multicopper oxidase with cupredoxin domain
MQRRLGWTASAILAIGMVACGGSQPRTTSQAGQPPQAAGPPLSTKNMPAIAGQQKTCAGPRNKTFDVDVVETTGIDLGMGITFAAWAYNGHLPGPTLEACQGDDVTINVHNKGTTSHGLDTHAFKIV